MNSSTTLALLLSASSAGAQLPWTWSRLAPLQSPSPRGAPAMAYDSLRDRVVLFGGYDGTAALADTWEWDGANWSQRQPATSPPGRWHHAMAFDPGRGRVVLFGGYPGALPPLADTWEWDGTTWTQYLPIASPPARLRHIMSHDPVTRRTLLLGGDDGYTHRPGTWLWDGALWHQSPVPTPPARSAGAMAFDPVANRTVLFGGHLGNPARALSETWEWSGFGWSQRLTAVAPSARAGHAMAAHPTQGCLILFGGDNQGTVNGETWQLDQSGWSQILTPGPSLRRWHGLVYQAGRGSWLLFGGEGYTRHAYQGDTWELAPGAFSVVGAGCAGRNGVPGLWSELPPRIGHRFDVHFRNAPVPLAGIMIVAPSQLVPPADLAGSGMPGCWLHVTVWPSIFSALGPAPYGWSRAIPNSAAMIGSQIFLQAALLDSGANAAGLIVSDAARAGIGF